jgi:hypothetical protein
LLFDVDGRSAAKDCIETYDRLPITVPFDRFSVIAAGRRAESSYLRVGVRECSQLISAISAAGARCLIIYSNENN